MTQIKQFSPDEIIAMLQTDFALPLDSDNDIVYSGDTENEKQLNKRLFETTLDLNRYQDQYDQMRTITEIKERIDNRTQLINSDFISELEKTKYEAEVKALTWVLNDSKTEDEKWELVGHKLTESELKEFIQTLTPKEKQLSISDYDLLTGELCQN